MDAGPNSFKSFLFNTCIFGGLWFLFNGFSDNFFFDTSVVVFFRPTASSRTEYAGAFRSKLLGKHKNANQDGTDERIDSLVFHTMSLYVF